MSVLSFKSSYYGLLLLMHFIFVKSIVIKPELTKLPNVIESKISKYLNIKDLSKIREVNKYFGKSKTINHVFIDEEEIENHFKKLFKAKDLSKIKSFLYKINKENNGTITNKTLIEIITISIKQYDFEFTEFVINYYKLKNLNTLLTLVENRAPFYLVRNFIKSFLGVETASNTKYVFLTISNPGNVDFMIQRSVINHNLPPVLSFVFEVVKPTINIPYNYILYTFIRISFIQTIDFNITEFKRHQKEFFKLIFQSVTSYQFRDYFSTNHNSISTLEFIEKLLSGNTFVYHAKNITIVEKFEESLKFSLIYTENASIFYVMFS